MVFAKEIKPDELYEFNGMPQRKKYFVFDVLSLTVFAGFLWVPIGSVGFSQNSPLVIGAWLFIAFCLHMASVRIFLREAAMIVSLASFLRDRLGLENFDDGLEIVEQMIREGSFATSLKTGERATLEMIPNQDSTIHIHIKKATAKW